VNRRKTIATRFSTCLSPKALLLEFPEYGVGKESEHKCEFKANIPAIHSSSYLSDRSFEPHLSHAHDRSKYPKGKSRERRNARREFSGSVVILRCIAAKPLLIDEVLRKSDAFVDSQPVCLREVSELDFMGNEWRAKTHNY
jgi:hypothetical protein